MEQENELKRTVSNIITCICFLLGVSMIYIAELKFQFILNIVSYHIN